MEFKGAEDEEEIARAVIEAGMAEPPKKSCPDPEEIRVINILEPNQLVVILKDAERYNELIREIEAGISREYARDASLREFAPNTGTNVSVCTKDNWRRSRGQIYQIHPNVSTGITKYSVLLYDYGTLITCELKDLASLSLEHVYRLMSLSFIVTLPGLVPAKVHNLIPAADKNEATLVRANEWSWNGVQLVEEWCDFSKEKLLLLSYFDQSKITRFGQILTLDGTSLSEMLIANQIALFDQALMDQQINPKPPDMRNVKKEGKKKLSVPVCYSGRKRIDQSSLTEEISMEKESSSSSNTPPEVPVKKSIEKVILTYGIGMSEAYEKASELPFFDQIQNSLKMLGVAEGTSLQRHIWPQILNRRNVFIVSSPQQKDSGSVTLSYLIPLYGQLLENWDNILETEPESKGPSTLIICLNGKNCRAVEDKLEILSRFASKRKSCSSCANGCEKCRTNADKIRGICMEDMEDDGLLWGRNRSEILVTTPEVALELVENHAYLNYGLFQRLNFIVFEDFNTLLKIKLEKVTSILRRFKIWTEKVKTLSLPFQAVFCSTFWTPALEDAYKNLVSNPLLVIGSVSRVISYAQIPIKAHLFQNEMEKLNGIKDLVGNGHRILIVCRDGESSRKVFQTLLSGNDGSILNLLDDNGIEDELKKIKERWNESEDQIIVICTDESIGRLQIRDASALIHYELPPGKLETYATRFLAMRDHFRDISEEIESKKPRMISHVLLTKDESNIAGIVKTLKNDSAEIGEELENFVKIAELNEKEKRDFCLGLKEYGFCNSIDRESCSLRHFFTRPELSCIPRLPSNSELDFQVVAYKSPLRYIGQMLRSCKLFRDASGKLARGDWTDHRSEAEEITSSLESYYSEKSNLKICKEPNLGSLIAILSDDNSYLRGEISDIVTRDKVTGKPSEVRVFLLDFGYTVQRGVRDLYELSTELASIPACTIEVIVSGLQPPLGENEFSLKNITVGRKIVDGLTLRGKILLSIGNTVWVNPVIQIEKYQKADGGWRWESRQTIRPKLIKIRVADVNNGHLDLMYATVKGESELYLGEDQTLLESFFSNEIEQSSEAKEAEEGKNALKMPDIVPQNEEDEEEIAEEGADEAAIKRREARELEELNRSVNQMLNLEADVDEEEEDFDEEEMAEGVPEGYFEQDFDVYVGNNDDIYDLLNLPRPRLPNGFHLPDVTGAMEANEEANAENISRANVRRVVEPPQFMPPPPHDPNALKKAEVRWNQTETSILLTFFKPDVRDFIYTVGDDKRSFSFKTNDPPGYGFDLKLWAKVEREAKAEVFGQYVKIKLEKRRKILWERITESTEPKCWWLKHSLGEDDSDSEEESGKGKKKRIFDYQEVDYDNMLEEEAEENYDSDEAGLEGEDLDGEVGEMTIEDVKEDLEKREAILADLDI